MLSLNSPLWKLFRWFRRPQLWATGDGQLITATFLLCTMSHAEFFGETWNHPGDSIPLQPRFCTLQFLGFPKIKITFEKEEILDHQWVSGKYDRVADGDWENCIRSQGAYFERDWGIIVLCTMFLVFCIIFNICIYFS